MTSSEASEIIDALTRSTVRRDKLGVIGSDEELLQRLAVSRIDPQRVRWLTALSGLLRLMDGLRSGAETGEGFVEKFSTLWPSLRATYVNDLRAWIDKIDQFYGDIQLFCASERDRQEEPLLFGVMKLKELTECLYVDLKQWWLNQLTGQAGS